MANLKHLEQVHQLTNAIVYALDVAEEGLIWLRLWNEGDITTMAELDRYILLENLNLRRATGLPT